MRDLAIAYGNNRQAKKWVNKTISYDDLKARLKMTIRTTESAEEYAKMSSAKRLLCKRRISISSTGKMWTGLSRRAAYRLTSIW